MKEIFSEFKKFIARGNVVDMAVGIIMGAAFTGIVQSLVKDVFMPVVSKILGEVNFTHFKIILTPATDTVPETAIYYGNFLQKSVDFLLIALVVFILIRAINKLHKKAEAPAPESAKPAPEVELLSEIRDLLKKEK